MYVCLHRYDYQTHFSTNPSLYIHIYLSIPHPNPVHISYFKWTCSQTVLVHSIGGIGILCAYSTKTTKQPAYMISCNSSYSVMCGYMAIHILFHPFANWTHENSSPQWGSNSRPLVYKTSALATELWRRICSMRCWTVSCLRTIWFVRSIPWIDAVPTPRVYRMQNVSNLQVRSYANSKFLPGTWSLGRILFSTHIVVNLYIDNQPGSPCQTWAPSEDRTHDPWFTRPVL